MRQEFREHIDRVYPKVDVRRWDSPVELEVEVGEDGKATVSAEDLAASATKAKEKETA